jgi:membrane-bound serine protease (ClpP class)
VIRFRKLDLVGQATHTLTSPSIAYLLLVIGLALIVFEFFTISSAWLVGRRDRAHRRVRRLLAPPVTWWALGLILVAMFGTRSTCRPVVPWPGPSSPRSC